MVATNKCNRVVASALVGSQLSMAISPDCPSLVVEILVNGVPVQEYNSDKADQEAVNTVTKYIEAQSGAHFAIKVSFVEDPPLQRISNRVHLDGEEVSGTLLSHCTAGEEYLDEGRISKIGSQTVVQKYYFSEMNIVEGNTGRFNAELLTKLAATGTIKVAFQGACNRISTPDEFGATDPMVLSSVDTVPEKALKGQAKTHRASLSVPQQASSMTWCHWDDIGLRPFAIFEFKYCSRAALQTLHLIPRTPTPVPLEERAEEDLSPEELRQLVKRLKDERKATALKIKKEKLEKRKHGFSVGDESDETDDFEIVEASNKRRRRGDPKDVIVLD